MCDVINGRLYRRDFFCLHGRDFRVEFLFQSHHQLNGVKGIGTQVHYIPVHRQPYYRDRYDALDLPGSERYYGQCLSLPFYPGMGDQDVERVVNNLKSLLAS